MTPVEHCVLSQPETHRQRSLALSGLAIDAPAVSRRPPPTPATHLQEGEGEDACVAGDAGEGASRVAQAEGTDAAVGHRRVC